MPPALANISFPFLKIFCWWRVTETQRRLAHVQENLSTQGARAGSSGLLGSGRTRASDDISDHISLSLPLILSEIISKAG